MYTVCCILYPAYCCCCSSSSSYYYYHCYCYYYHHHHHHYHYHHYYHYDHYYYYHDHYYYYHNYHHHHYHDHHYYCIIVVVIIIINILSLLLLSIQTTCTSLCFCVLRERCIYYFTGTGTTILQVSLTRGQTDPVNPLWIGHLTTTKQSSKELYAYLWDSNEEGRNKLCPSCIFLDTLKYT